MRVVVVVVDISRLRSCAHQRIYDIVWYARCNGMVLEVRFVPRGGGGVCPSVHLSSPVRVVGVGVGVALPAKTKYDRCVHACSHIYTNNILLRVLAHAVFSEVLKQRGVHSLHAVPHINIYRT